MATCVGLMCDCVVYARALTYTYISIQVIYASNWWVVATSNIFLGMQQALVWSATIFIMIDYLGQGMSVYTCAYAYLFCNWLHRPGCVFVNGTCTCVFMKMYYFGQGVCGWGDFLKTPICYLHEYDCGIWKDRCRRVYMYKYMQQKIEWLADVWLNDLLMFYFPENSGIAIGINETVGYTTIAIVTEIAAVWTWIWNLNEYESDNEDEYAHAYDAYAWRRYFFICKSVAISTNQTVGYTDRYRHGDCCGMNMNMTINETLGDTTIAVVFEIAAVWIWIYTRMNMLIYLCRYSYLDQWDCWKSHLDMAWMHLQLPFTYGYTFMLSTIFT